MISAGNSWCLLNLFSLKEKRVTEVHQCVVLLRESVVTLLWFFKK